ncbi:MAG: iron-sulfur cluster carrier protein ApbC [Legionellales bacterium]|jgi:ATP-binding protein involved in chromosome partitioning
MHIPGVKTIIAIASGKGGVGKSTVTTNVALALQAQGARVGILDADIYGPSQPHLLGLSGKPEIINNKMQPLQAYGLQVMSIGFLVDESAAMIWRGPMVSGALMQLLNDTAWDKLDYLLLDLPPGTGDIQLTMAQKIPVNAAVLVTTPQDLALLDVLRAQQMFNKVNVPVLGVIENMSGHTCSACGHHEAIFGEGGAAEFAKNHALTLLGKVPLDIHIREAADAGKPVVMPIYLEISQQIKAQLALQKPSFAHILPKVVVEHKKG